MRTIDENMTHTIYGVSVFGRAGIIYVGCTQFLPTRITALRNQNPVLRHLRNRLQWHCLDGAEDKRSGLRKETMHMTRLKLKGQCELNFTPSAPTASKVWKNRRAIERAQIITRLQLFPTFAFKCSRALLGGRSKWNSWLRSAIRNGHKDWYGILFRIKGWEKI